MTTANISYGAKLGLLNNAAIGETYYDQLRLFLRGMDALVQGSAVSTTVPAPPSTVLGLVTSGVFIDGETVTQTTSGVTATLVNVNTNLIIYGVTGTPDATNTWVGGSSGAEFTPTSAPGNPSEGDGYLLLSTPSGIWTGMENKLAVWSNQKTITGSDTLSPGWTYYTPNSGWILWANDLQEFLYFNESLTWVSLISAGIPYPSGTGIPTISGGSSWGSTLPLSGAGSGVVTGPTTSTSGDIATFTGTSGQIADSGTLLSSLAPLASPTFTGSPTVPGYLTTASASSTYAPLASPTFTGTVSTTSNLASVTAGTPTIGTVTKWFGSVYVGNASNYVNITPATPSGNYNLTIPTLGASDTIATLGLTQTFGGTNVSFTGSILATTAGTPSLGSTTKWWNSAYLGNGATYYVNLITATPSASRTLTIPALAANDTIATLGLGNAFTGSNSFSSSIVTATAGTGSLGSTTKWWNSAYLGTGTSYYVNLTPATPTASYSLTIPTLAANDTLPTLGLAQTFTKQQTFSVAGAVSAASVLFSGTPYTSGTATTNFPQVSIWPSGATGPTTWSATGTMFGINAASGFTGNLIDGHINGGSSVFSVGYGGNIAGKGFVQSTVSKSSGSPYTATATDYVILVTITPYTVTLPTSGIATGQIYIIKATAASPTVTISPASGTIDGSASATISAQYGFKQVQFDGTNYWIIG